MIDHCKFWLLMLITLAPLCMASPNRPSGMGPGAATLLPEPQFTSMTLYRADTGTQLSAQARPSCETSQPPQALATPDPLLVGTVSGTKVAISFVIGADGRVHSPVILESAGLVEDQGVLDAVLAWRYRPATCNATPTETESRVEFSIH